MSNILWADRIGAPTFGEFMATLPFPPTAEQQDVIQAQAPALLVVAGAGSGKTATMSQRIVWHVAAGHVQPGEVLGLTFTRKAAGELSERVSAGLAAARAAGLLPEHGAQSDPPTVATYNSFAAEIAASYALLIGEDPRARLITEAERWQIMDYLVSEWGAREGQKISDDHPLAQAAPSTIVAVALELAAAITDNGIALDTARNFLEREIAALTQLSTARTAAGYFRKGPYSGTEVPAGFNALARSDSSLRLRWAAIDLVAEYFAYKRENSLVEFADQVAWAGKILQAAPEIGARLRSRFKLILLDEYQDTSPNQAQFLRAAFFSERKLEEQKADMPSAACGDLADTSAVCTETAALRCAPVVSVCAVGDPNQAIYGWRGAGADSLADFAREFQVAPEARFTLSTAFRNSTKILAVANALTAESSHTDVKMLLREEFPKAGVLDRPWLAEKSAHSQADSLALPVLHPAPAAPPGKVVHIHCNLSGEEHDAIARAIREEFAAAARQRERDVQRAQQERKQLRPYQPPTAAVLVRKHKYAQPMMEALQAQGLTCVNVSGQMLGSAPEIRTVRALLGIAFFPSRGDLLVQVLNFFALGVQDLRALGSIRRTIPVAGSQRVSLVEAAAEVARRGREEAVREGFTPTGYLRIQKVAAAAQRLRDMGQLPVAEIVQIACEELGLFELAASRVTGGASMGRTLSRFLATASSFDGQAGGAAYRSELPIQSFLRWLEVAER
ncbi:MAG: ATP-dependent helicase, partial [Arcanobacterium sp.]|nr:ATP-dependent helicase [Arcanobacterium sp.]